MIKKTKIETRKGVYKEVLEYTLHAFKSSKGTFTLSGTSGEHDEFKNLNTLEFIKCNRNDVKEWIDKGLIHPVPESTTIDWYFKIIRK